MYNRSRKRIQNLVCGFFYVKLNNWAAMNRKKSFFLHTPHVKLALEIKSLRTKIILNLQANLLPWAFERIIPWIENFRHNRTHVGNQVKKTKTELGSVRFGFRIRPGNSATFAYRIMCRISIGEVSTCKFEVLFLEMFSILARVSHCVQWRLFLLKLWE